MLLNLSDSHASTVTLTPDERVLSDVSISEGCLSQHPEESRMLYDLILQKFPAAWESLSSQIPENKWISLLASGQKHLNLSVILVNNDEIHSINRDFRNKDTATDVLTFTLLDEAAEGSGINQLPELDLGEIYLSVTWAIETVSQQLEPNREEKLNFSSSLTLFILERLVHGCLHLLGVHHDTMADYNKVKEIQRLVLHVVT